MSGTQAQIAGRRIAVVLFNLGGPDGPKAVRPFLFNLFNDPAIIGLPSPLRQGLAALISTTRARSARANYDLMGGRSPIEAETRAQAQTLSAELARRMPQAKAQVFVAMRYWAPFTVEAAREVEAFEPDEVVLLPLYPQFSTTTTASSLQAWGRVWRGRAPVRAVCCYPTEPGLITAHARRIDEAWTAAGRPGPVRLLFSAHGLPERVVAAGDPYQAQIEATARGVAAELGAQWDWTLCYQSRVGPLKWLGPATPQAIAAAVEDGVGVILSPIAFVSEHVETLVELDHEYAALARSLGCSVYIRAPALGVTGDFIGALAQTVLGALAREPGVQTACGGRWCGAEWSKCPAAAAAAATSGESA